MNAWIERAYYASPVVLQNLAISVYGCSLHRTRYGGRADEELAGLLNSQWYSRAELEELQRAKLKEIVGIAYNRVRYYRELFDEIGLRPDGVKNLADLTKIPPLGKDVLRETPQLLVSGRTRGRLLRLYTSGTSGTPLEISCDVESRRRHYAFVSRFRSWFGIKVGMKRATLCGRIVVPPGRKDPPFWRYDLTENNHLFSSYHLSEGNLRHYYNKLSEIRPDEICAYPSSIFAVARYIEKNRLPRLESKLVMTTAETLFDHQRETIESAFSCPLRDQYGCTEMALFVSQCGHGSYHVHPEYGLVEVLGEDGDPVAPGQEGEVVCTSFVNKTMPLIRYRLGDRIVMDGKPCGCGRAFPVVREILGRVDDVITTPDGRPIGRLDPIFKGLRGIVETQIVQTSADTLCFRVVKDRSFGEEDEKELLFAIRKRVGDGMGVRFEYVPEIPRDRNGKFRSVVSLAGGIR